MNFWFEALEMFGIPLVVISLLIGGFVWLHLGRQQRLAAHFPDGALHRSEWDFTVDGKVMATLIPTGPPKAPEDRFIIDEVRIVAGHEAEVLNLLYQPGKRAADDSRICYQSRSGDGVILKDSQVQAEPCGENRVRMKFCPSEMQFLQAAEFFKGHHALPRSLERPVPRAG